VPAGAGAFEVVGWVFSAKDLASAVVLKAETTIAKSSGGIGKSLATVALNTMEATKKIGQSWSAFGTKFSAGWDNLGPRVQSVSNLLAAFGLEKVPAFLNNVKAVGDEMRAVFDAKEYTKAFGVMVKGLRELGAFKAVAKVLRLEFKLLTLPIKMVAKSITSVAKGFLAFGRSPLVGIKKVGEGFFFMGRKAAGAAVQVGSLFQKVLGLADIKETIGKGGGFIGTFLGPLGGVFKLLTPIIDLISKVFSPLIEGISAHLENVLGPLQMTMEMIAQDLGPKLAKLLVPIVSLIEMLVSQAGVFISEMLEGGTVAGPIMKAVQDIMPSVQKLLGAIGATVVKILPVFLHIFQRVVPIVAKVVEYVAEFAAELLPKLGDMIAEVGPPLIDAFAKTLDALIPLLPVLGKLAIVLVEKVLGPAMVKTLTFLANFVDKHMPEIVVFIDAFAIGVEKLTDKVSYFFDNFGIMMSEFKLLLLDWIKPLKDGVNEVLAMFGLGDLQSQWDKMTKAFMSPLVTLKGAMNALIIDPLNSVLTGKLPWVGSIGEALNISPFEYLAKGGVATGAAPVPGVFGEAGPELIMPLTPSVVERVLAPMLEFPGLDRAVAVLESIDRRLGGVLQVDGGQETTATESVSLLDAVGIHGVT